jgi:hypothetical protein
MNRLMAGLTELPASYRETLNSITFCGATNQRYRVVANREREWAWSRLGIVRRLLLLLTIIGILFIVGLVAVGLIGNQLR